MRNSKVILKAAAFVEYETFVLNADGSVSSHRKPKRNLILDQGLNQVASNYWAQCFRSIAVGTGTNPTKRDSGATTFSRAGTTVTASANFFEAADVGRLLKFDSGQEMYVTAFTDAQTVTVNLSGTIGASEGTVWYVNDTGLQTEVARTSTCSTGGGECGSSFSVDTYTHKRTFIFPAAGSNVTYREIGWSPTATAGANLFGRDIIPGGDSVLTGQQYKVIVRLFLVISPVTTVAQADVGNNGFNTTGNANHQYILSAYSTVDSSGNTTSAGMEPSNAPRVAVCSADFTLNSGVSYTDSFSTTSSYLTLMGFGSYTNGTFTRSATLVVPIGSGNGSVYGFQFGLTNGGLLNRNFAVKFTTPQTKDSDHTLGITLTESWGRVLTN